ncbi:hypothetical protein [Actinophytocola gossypii]|uniref:Uncharacterized protein n=1 Tax=Actinophytocola gossypii TaxID=2812003 RepID=A0ABT2J5S4_9PSEU|nr:hypothetical protein [Actinophytocola gossypii]MCT2583031.1 hypothetical protein [Actinophytocola gossypii]
MSDGWYTYNGQIRRIRELRDDIDYVSSSLASARSSQRRLHAELSKVQGSLEQRLDRLSAAFDAFVEISDLRVTLGLFDEQARIRHVARRVLDGLTDGEVPDVDGYWLAPALVALTDPAPPVTALALDPRRATVFHVLGTGLLGGRETVSAALLADALPALGPTLATHRRAVWTLAADGFFGDAGRELVRRRGAEFVGGLDSDAAVDAITELGTARAEPTAVPKGIEDAADLSAALDAGARLAALRAWVDDALGGHRDEPAPDPSVRRCLELLIDEGSPDELPLLARERELRAVIEGDGGTPATWDGPAGETLATIHADAADAEHPARRALAVRMCAPHVLAAAERLAETARRPFPARVRARTRQGTVTIAARGVESLDAARRRIELAARVSEQRRYTAYGAAGVAAVFLVLTVVGWAWVLGAVAALGVAGYQWRTDSRERADAIARAEKARTALAAEVDERVAAVAECRSALAERQSTVDEHLGALRSALG